MPSGRWAGSSRLARLPANWRQIRSAVFSIYGDVCHVCQLHGADEVDHLVAGDDHSLANLRPIHGNPCHRRKSSQEGGKAWARKRGTIRRPPEAHPGLL